MNYSKTEQFARRKKFAIGLFLSFLFCFPFSIKAEHFSFFIPHLELDTCPSIGTLGGIQEVCLDETFELTVLDLSLFDSLENGETNFGVEFVFFNSTPVDPYFGGTSLGVIPFGSFENDSTASLPDIVFNSGGTFEIYAILNPIPSDISCRPFVFDTLIVNYLPSALINLTNPFCPGDTSGAIDVTVGGTAPFTFDWFTIGGSGLEEGLEDQSNLSGGIYLVTITDGSPAACQQDYSLYLNDGDFTPPDINCPGNISEYLGSGECNTIINFTITAWDECSIYTQEPIVTQIDSSGLSSGSYFPIGVTTLEYQAEDGSGNISTCSFQIEILPYPNPSQSLTCNTGSSITLDENCSALIEAQHILTGGPYFCFDDYQVDLFYDEDLIIPIVTSPFISSTEVGLTIYVKVTDPQNNNYCSGSLNVEDYIIPSLSCQSFTIFCTDDFFPGSLGILFPLPEDVTVNPDYGIGPFTVDGFDPCGSVTLEFSDVEESGDCLNDNFLRKYIRSWTATDESGNLSTCVDTIVVIPSSINEVVIPFNRDNISAPALYCSGGYELDDQGNPSPNETGWPTLNGMDLIDSELCEIATAYSDDIIEICDGTNKIIRNWTIISWCPVTEVFTGIQIIDIIDDQGPEIECPSDITISTSSNDCFGSAILPNPVLSDLCASALPTFAIETTQGLLNGMTLYNIPLGATIVTYTASDDCGNQSECSFTITVEDQVAPVPVCENYQTISLNNSGATIVPANTFDNSSFDNCGTISILARRLDNPECPGNDATNFNTQVPFFCCDVLTDHILVELQVTDAAGNLNFCIVEVSINDNLNPEIICPPDVVLDCLDDPYDLQLTGEASANDNCEVAVTYITQGTLDDCNEGILFRIWTAQDSSGNEVSCVQQIEMINNNPFGLTNITWPQDYSTTTCTGGLDPIDLTSPFDMPEYTDGPCDLISQEYQDIYLPINDPGCITILRDWTVYNWCIFEPNNPGAGGIWEHTQVIEVLNSEAPIILNDCSPMVFCSYDPNCETGGVQLFLNALDDCTDSLDLNYSYELDLYDDGSVEISGTGFELIDYFPLGDHKLNWQVEDACGNITSCEQYFSIVDCLPPTIHLLNGIAVEIGETAQIELQAEAWDSPASPSTFDNCGISNWLIYSPSLGQGQSIPPIEADTSWVFDCEHLGTQTVDIWVEDINGNWAYVSTDVIVEDNDFPPDCPVSAYMMISGQLQTEDADLIENVMMQVESNAPSIPEMIYSNVEGYYEYPEMLPGGDYMIIPELNTNPLNGVSTYDLVKISQHILEIDVLDSPFQRIAADINHSGNITTIDILLLQRLILQIDTAFQNNTSWRFVDADFVFPNPGNPWQTLFPEYYEVLGIQDSMTADFVGIKIGDINNSAETNGFDNEEDPEFGSTINFKTRDIFFGEGEEVTVEIKSDQLEDLLGFQTTISFDQEVLEFIGIENFNFENLSMDNFGFSYLDNGLILCSWYNAFGVSVIKEHSFFTMKFKAKSPGRLSDVLDFNDSMISNESYTCCSKERLELKFEGYTDHYTSL
jgi:HYR domain-containing protein